MIPATHRQIRLAARPTGYPRDDDFRIVESPVPEPGSGEFLVRVVYLSLDPYMRGRMSDARSYVPPVAVGDVMEGGIVGEVVRSNHPGFAVGDVVEGRLGWQEYALSSGKGARRIDPALAPISTALGVLGMPGLTAYFGLLDVGQPKAGETVVVSAASGAVGGLVGQIAKLKGCRAVGLAGTDAKVRYLTEELGYDAGINYRTAPNLDAALQATCPGGIDVYFDNVGGDVLDAVLTRLARGARIVLCGAVSQYNAHQVRGPANYLSLLVSRASMTGMLVFDYHDRFGPATAELAQWLSEGRLVAREHIVHGSVTDFPEVLLKLFAGENTGKLILATGAS